MTPTIGHTNPDLQFARPPDEAYGWAPTPAGSLAPWMVYRRADGRAVLSCLSRAEAEAHAAALNADVRARRIAREAVG